MPSLRELHDTIVLHRMDERRAASSRRWLLTGVLLLSAAIAGGILSERLQAADESVLRVRR